MTSVLIIRFHYAENDPRFEWRFNYFKKEVFPRILNQNDSDFDIAIWCNPAHDELFSRLSPRIRTFKVKNERVNYKTGKRGKRYFEDFVPWEDVIGLPQYDLQMGLDSDDLIGPNYVRLIKMNLKGETGSVHISFQPMLLRLKGRRISKMMAYSPERGSAFLALYQPDKTNYKFIYSRSHISMGKCADKSITLGSGHCWATAHNLNETTGK